MPITTLLSLLLYPTLESRELLSQMRSSGVSTTTVIGTQQLIEAFVSDDR